MLTKEELKDLYKRIDNLEADKTSLLSANKKLKENYGKVESRSISYQKDYKESADREKLLKEQLAQEKQLRADVINNTKQEVKRIERILEKQRKKNREKTATIKELRGY